MMPQTAAPAGAMTPPAPSANAGSVSAGPSPAGAPSAAAPGKSRRTLFLRLLALAAIIGGAGWLIWYVLYGRWYESTDDAYVQGNVVQITPQVQGTVVAIGADDGNLVHAGDVLVKLDPSDADVVLAGAEANLANTVRKVRGLYSNVGSAKADMAMRKVAVDKARADYNRRNELATSGAISAEELAHASDALTSAQSAFTASQQQVQTSKVLVDDTVVASHPEVRSAAAKLRSAYLDRMRATIVAPVTGYVAKRTVQVGQRIQPGEPMMAVVPLHQVWVDANFTETQLREMRIGQPASIRADVYGRAVRYTGRIESLGVGTGSAFSLLPAQNATGNWIKIVQRLPVRIVLTQSEQLDKYPLRIGLSTKVDVDLHDQRGFMLAQQPPDKPFLSTDVYSQQLAQVDTLIDEIVHANNRAGDAAAGQS